MLYEVYQMPDGFWAAICFHVIAEGFSTELEAWQWVAHKLALRIEMLESAPLP